MSNVPNSASAQGVFEPLSIDVVPWETFTRGTRFGMRYQHPSAYGA